MTKKVVVITMTAVASLSCGAFSAFLFFSSSLTETKAINDPNKLVFNTECELYTLEANSKKYEYAYTNTSLGNKYGVIVDSVSSDIEHEDDDLLIIKGTSNYIYFSYGDINNDATYTEAEFSSGIKTVSITTKYVAPNDYNLYMRCYYSQDGTYSDSYRKGYTVTKEYTTISFDLSSYNAKYIKLALSNAFSTYHIKDITVEYNC